MNHFFSLNVDNCRTINNLYLKLLILSSYFLITSNAYSVNYTTIANGNYNNCAIWNPGCPPNPINFGDTVFIQHNIILQFNINIDGVVIIDPAASVSGNFDIDISIQGTLINDGNINISQGLHIDGDFYNNGYAYALDIHNDGYICNTGTIEIDPSETFKIHGGVVECGGLILACDIELDPNGGNIPQIEEQDICCSDGTEPTIDNSGGIVDAVSVLLCNQAFIVDAGLDSNTTICNLTSSFVDLNTLLSGAEEGGTWAETSASGTFNQGTAILNTESRT